MTKAANIVASFFDIGEQLEVVDWVKKHVKNIPYSPRPFSIDNPPMFAEILNEIINPINKHILILACVQSGKTLAPELALAYLIKNKPAPTLWLNQTDAEAKDQNEGRLKPLFDTIEPLKNLYNIDKNKMRKDTMIFNNSMTLWTLGQNNLRNLQRRSICYVFGDETWQWERGRMAEVEARTTAFTNGKCIFMSQAGKAEDDTDIAWTASDQREWTWTCPNCGNEWQPAIEHFNEQNATMTCPHCKTVFEDNEFNRFNLNKTAKFVKKNKNAVLGKVGFHWNSFSTMPWKDIASIYQSAKLSSERGDDLPLEQFYQKRLATVWNASYHSTPRAQPQNQNAIGFKTNQDWSDEGVIEIRGNRTPLRFLTVDVQKDYFYFVVRSWTRDGRSRLRDCGIAQSFEDLLNVASRHSVFNTFSGIDSGFNTDDVFKHCAIHGWTALRGDSRNEWAFRYGNKTVYKIFSPKEITQVAPRQYAARHFYSNTRCKDILANLIEKQDRWQLPDNIPQNYTKMLSSEKKNEKGVWEQIGHRPNHYWDCEVMQVAIASMVGLFGGQINE